MLAVVVALAAVCAVVATASAEKPTVVRVGNLKLTVNGGFKPKRLSPTKLTPITFNAEATIETVDGTHPPALREFILQTDKNGAINVKGIPACRPGRLQAQDTRQAEAACPHSIIGTGTGTVQIAFEEQAPVYATSKLVVFSGGVKGGVTTLYVHAYITVPVPAAIVSVAKIHKIHKGRFGTEAVTTIPKIAGGAGSPTHFALSIWRHGVLEAKCTDGRLQAHGTAIFSDGTRASAGVVRPCTATK